MLTDAERIHIIEEYESSSVLFPDVQLISLANNVGAVVLAQLNIIQITVNHFNAVYLES